MVQARGNNDLEDDTENFCLDSAQSPSLAHLPQSAIDEASKIIVDDLVDTAILGVVFEVYRSLKSGLLFLEQGIEEDEEEFAQVNVEGLDVFGMAPVKKQHECVCPNCSRNLAAARFAPHLEKCMGMGRNSSRIASRRIQNSSRESSSHAGQVSDDDDEDDDWVERKRRKRDKNSPRRSRAVKVKVDQASGNSSNGSLASVASNGSLSTSSAENILLMSSTDDKRAILSQMCGVISEHTGKMCTRSMRCPQHTNDQRRAVRDQFLTDGVSRPADSTTGASKFLVNEESQMDHDGFEHSSWDHDLSNTTSPADSTSTNNSSSTATSSSSSSSNTKKSNSSGKSKKKSSKTKKEMSIPE